MAAPEGALLRGTLEVDETTMPCRNKDDDPMSDSRGRSHLGKVALIAAVEVEEEGRPGRTRLEILPDHTAGSIGRFVRSRVEPGAALVSDGLQAYRAPERKYGHDSKVVGKMAAHVVLPWAHWVFSLLERWGTGTFHGFRRPRLQAHLDGFAWRWNRRNSRRTGFNRLLCRLGTLPHRACRDFVPRGT